MSKIILRQAQAFGSEAQVFDSELRLEELEEMMLSQAEASNLKTKTTTQN